MLPALCVSLSATLLTMSCDIQPERSKISPPSPVPSTHTTLSPIREGSYDVICEINSCEVRSENLSVILVKHEGGIGLRPMMVRGQVVRASERSGSLALKDGREISIVNPSQAHFAPIDWVVEENGLKKDAQGKLLIGGMGSDRDDLIIRYDRPSDISQRITVREFLIILEGQPEMFVQTHHSTDHDVFNLLRARFETGPFVSAVAEALDRLNPQQ